MGKNVYFLQKEIIFFGRNVRSFMESQAPKASLIAPIVKILRGRTSKTNQMLRQCKNVRNKFKVMTRE